MTEHKRDETQRVVRREVFMRDPEAVAQRARTEGTIAITDGAGTPRLLICIPTDKLPDVID